MLSSWFSQKPSQAASPVDDKPRRSFDVRYNAERPSTSKEVNPPRSSLDNPRPVHTTPHDAIIAGLHASTGDIESPSPISIDTGRANRYAGGPDDGQRSPLTPTGISPSVSNSRLELNFSPSASTHTGATTTNLRYAGAQPGGNSAPTTTVDVLLDPFDGTSHGVLLPQDGVSIGHEDPLSGPRFNSTSVAAASERMWSHLSKVLDLQSQISKMHIEMEGVGVGETRKKTKGKHSIRPSIFGEDRRMYHPPTPSLRARAMSNASTIGTVVDEKEADEEGVGVTDEETEKNRAREEEFAKLASQFKGKKDSIKEMMDKLDDLSKALTEFHALQSHDANDSKPESASTTPPITLVFPSKIGLAERTSHPHLPENMLWAAPKPLLPQGNTGMLPKSLSRLTSEQNSGKPSHLKVQPPPPITNTGALPHLTESPLSTLGSLDLPPGD